MKLPAASSGVSIYYICKNLSPQAAGNLP